jgi:hypothetical protein
LFADEFRAVCAAFMPDSAMDEIEAMCLLRGSVWLKAI